ncbi:MAG: hypothetical protein LUI04_06880, partial [Porphyromonadaceae bacterium]|nr:hypothetical protein [Porphyromonadaceae bacterium]
MRKYFILSIFLALISGELCAETQASERYASSSVLASGKWVKIQIDETGLYQLTYDQLQEYGFNDPDHVAVFGYGGAMLPEDFSTEYLDDLPQVPTLRTGNKLIFYAQGVISWTISGTLFTRTRNPYSMYGYYFLTELEEEPISPESIASSATTPALTVTTFHDRVLHEIEKVSPGRMGRNFYGEDFLYTTVQNFTFDILGITESPVTAQVRFLAKSTSSTSTVSLQINGGNTTSSSISPILDSDGQTYKCGVETTIQTTFTRNADDADVLKISFSGSGATAAYLDYILLNMERELRLYDGQVAFRHRSAATQRLQYEIDVTGASAPYVWDVTVPYAPQEIVADLSEGKLTFVPQETALREYVAFDASATFPSPTLVGSVSNQNLHGLSRADLVILTPSLFATEARR